MDLVGDTGPTKKRDLLEQMQKTKQASQKLVLLDDRQRCAVLGSLAKSLCERVDTILEENSKDLARMGKEDPLYDRLLLDKNRIHKMACELEDVIAMPSPVGVLLEKRVRPNGLEIHKVSVPFGVVGVIYESRPNVTVDVFSLCFKSGNACILKGGKEALNSNRVLVSMIHESLFKNDIDACTVLLFPAHRDETHILLNAAHIVDVCIPRGSQALIDFVRKNASIPVIETGAGIVHAYFDLDGDREKGRRIIHNAKTRRVSVCNALDCLLVHQKRLQDLYALAGPLEEARVEIFADPKVYEALSPHYPAPLLFKADPDDYDREFLSYKMAIKSVDSIDEALAHIGLHGSGHSETIITENKRVADYFVQQIDAAVIYVNASTAFTDGGQFGMGAEIGISTQKLHARGPMGVEALTSYKWIVYGNGHIRD